MFVDGWARYTDHVKEIEIKNRRRNLDKTEQIFRKIFLNLFSENKQNISKFR